jgi:hypothetical protein
LPLTAPTSAETTMAGGEGEPDCIWLMADNSHRPAGAASTRSCGGTEAGKCS